MAQPPFSHMGYKQLVCVELKWQPALLPLVRSLPQLAYLREILGVEAPIEREAQEEQLVSNQVVGKTSSPRLVIQAFGEPTVLLDGQPIQHWRMARAAETFFLLLDANRPLSKESLVTALWPEFDSQVNQTFHSTIHHLRKLLGSSCIVFQSGSYSLDLAGCYGEDVWYDVKEFQRLRAEAEQALGREDDDAARKALLRMVELYRGDYGRPFYSDWCTLRRDELRNSYLEAHRHLAQIAWRCRAYKDSVYHWHQILSIDNCQEEAHYHIMLCYLRQSKRSAALRQYQHCKKLLQQELGIGPGMAIEKLYQSLTRSADMV